MKEHEQFRQRLGEISCQPVFEQDTGEAYRNLSGFMSLLVKINKREQIVPIQTIRERLHENQ